MEIILLLIRLFLFVVFAAAGVAKLFDVKGSEKAVRDFGAPASLAPAIAIALPIAEILVALALLPVATSWFGAIGALLLLLAFIGGMIYQLAKGNAPDCHCFGQIHSEPVGASSLIRNGGFALLALFLAVQGPENQGISLAGDNLDPLQALIGIAIFGLLITAIFYLRTILQTQKELMRRIEIMGFIAGGDDAVERNEAGDPNDGLPIGAPLPDFAIPDLNGRIVQFDHLLAEGKPMLFFFVSPTCNPCEALIPEIADWKQEIGDRIKIVFVSSGTREANLAKFGDMASEVFLLEKDRQFAMQVNAKWTPTALFVDSNGNVASHVAPGDTAIRRMVERIKIEDLNKDHVYFLGMNGHGKPKIGQVVPELSMKDISGREITQDFFKNGRTLVAFTSLTCGHCATLMEQIRDWEASRKDSDPKIVIFSEGDVAEHEKFGVTSPIVLEKGYTTAKKLGMYGVPSGVLIDENGVIVSEAAVGGPNMWALIGRRDL